MKILFTSSSEYYRQNQAEFDMIRKVIEKAAPDSKVQTITDKKNSDMTTEKDLINLVKHGEKVLKESDVVIAESSFGSAGLGYDIAKVISMKKPALVLHREESGKPIPHPIRIESKLLSYRSYNDDNLATVVTKFLKEAKKKLDTKFILIISPEIDRYLEWSSENKRMHKAQVVRNAVEEAMKKDKEYKDYQKSM